MLGNPKGHGFESLTIVGDAPHHNIFLSFALDHDIAFMGGRGIYKIGLQTNHL